MTESNRWFLYMLRCRDRSLYTGITTDIQRRVQEHQSGGVRGAKSLKGKGPLRLVFSTELGGQSQALQLEYRIKQLPKATKERLVAGDITVQSVFKL